MRILLPLALAALIAVPATAQDNSGNPEKPITERKPDAVDVVATPASDLNLKKDEIPALLLAAQQNPYDVGGMRRCPAIAAAVGEFDAVLGPDIDLPQDSKSKASAGTVAQAAIGAFIPFRGLIREISGANAQERRIQEAIQAGMARRAFLKGYGQARGCRYPARASQLAVEDTLPPTPIAAAATSTDRPKRRAPRKGEVKFVSNPVVQKTD